MRRRWREDAGPAGGDEAAAGPVTTPQETGDSELDIERRWLLLARIDHEAFGEFFRKYHRPILSYLQHRVGDRTLAEDLLSETFLEAADSIGRFRLQGVTFGAFLYRLARRRVARHFELRRRRGEDPLVVAEHETAVPPEAPDAIEADQDSQLLALCLRQLSGTEQDIVVLYYYEGLRLDQIGVILDLDGSVVKARLHRARRKLAGLLEDPRIIGSLSRDGRQALNELRLDLHRMRIIGPAARGGREKA